jgi:hypothetical protein
MVRQSENLAGDSLRISWLHSGDDVESHNEENEMNNSHVTALRTKHAELDLKLEREENRPLPDAHVIHDLKKQKLHLKDILVQETHPG